MPFFTAVNGLVRVRPNALKKPTIFNNFAKIKIINLKMADSRLSDAQKLLSTLKLEAGKNGLRCSSALPCGHQLDLWTVLLLQDIQERLIQVERLVLPGSEDIEEAREEVNYEPFVQEP
jgi:hypothetical protein